MTTTHAPPRVVPPSRSRRVRLRRLLWRWRHLLLVAAVLCAGWVVVRELRPPPPVTVEVLVLARDVPAGTELTGADVRPAALPRELVAPGMLRSPGQAVGERVAVGLPAGFPVATEVLVGPGLASGTPPGQVVVPVRLADAAVARTLRPGDTVDLLAATADSAASAGGAQVVASAALVVALDESGGGGLLGGQETAALVFVAVPREAAPEIVGAGAWAPLRVVLPGRGRSGTRHRRPRPAPSRAFRASVRPPGHTRAGQRGTRHAQGVQGVHHPGERHRPGGRRRHRDGVRGHRRDDRLEHHHPARQRDR